MKFSKLGLSCLFIVGLLSGCSDKYNVKNFAINEVPENDWVISSSKKDDKIYLVEYVESPEKKIRVNSQVLFNFNKYDLREEGKAILDTLAPKIKDKRVKIVGHTDEIGSEKYNFILGAERAKAVRAYFISKGLNGEFMETFSAGESMPLVSCKVKTKECLAPNRRVEIVFVDVIPQKIKEKYVWE